MLHPFSTRARRTRSEFNRSRLTAALASVALVLGVAAVGGAAPAAAAGTGVLDLSMKAVDPTNGNAPVTDAQNGTGPAGYAPNNTITYLVQFSCSTGACDNAKVDLTPPPAAYGLLPAGLSILHYESWVAPAGVPGASIGGDDATGKVVDLGDLPSGSSGAFTVSYAYDDQPNREVPNAAFYPNGYQIEMAATMSSDTATADKTVDAAPVTWHIGIPTGPSATLGGGGTYQVDEPITLGVAVSAGNGVSGYNGCQTATASLMASGNYKIVYHVPATAVIDSATNPSNDQMTIDNTQHTVTWIKGSPASQVYGARVGFGSPTLGGTCIGPGVNNGATDDSKAYFGQRDVVIHFPSSNFPSCDFSEPFQTSVDVDVNYVDPAKTEGVLTGKTRSATLGCHAAYGGWNTVKDVTGGSTTSNGDGNMAGTYAILVPQPGDTDRVRDWRVRVGNRGNVPSVATVTEPNLASNPHVKVTQVYPDSPSDAPAGWGVKVDWTRNDGSTGTAAGVTAANKLVAPPGTWFTAVTVVTDPIPPTSVLPTDNAVNYANIHYTFGVDDGATIGDQVTNDATISMDYPGHGAGGTPIEDMGSGQPLTLPLTTTESRTIQLMQPTPRLYAAITAPAMAGGGQLNAVTPTTPVTWNVRARTLNVWPGSTIKPQVVFMAPEEWKVVPGSASMTAGAPAGVSIEYSTLVWNGVTRDVVIATWPNEVTPSTSGATAYGDLSVQAVPLATAPAGVAVGAAAFAGDASGHWSRAVGPYVTASHDFQAFDNSYTDAGDLDGDGHTDEDFAVTFGARAVEVAALPALAVSKEICQPDAAAADGCDWVTPGAASALVVPDDEDIKYRLTLTNSGNVDLTNAVATDVLPYDGDSRGSQFDQTLTGTSDTDAGLVLDYAASTSPGAGDWTAPEAGAKAIRFTATSLPIGGSLSTVFTTEVAGSAAEDDLGCNALAVDSDQTLGTSTPAVCAKLHITAPPTPGLALTKTAALVDTNSNGKADKGETINYSFKVDNTGNVDVIDASITDPKVGTTAPATQDIAKATSETFTASYVVKQADVDAGVVHNAATASGSWDDAGTTKTVDSNEDTADVDAVPADPELSIKKGYTFKTDANGNGRADKGDVLSYTFTVENTGNVTMTGVQPVDGRVSGITPGPVVLGPAESQVFTADYTVTQADVDGGDVVNSATATGTPPRGPGIISPPASVTTPGAVAAPSLSITKRADLHDTVLADGRATPGETISYSFTVTNTGNVTISNVTVADPMLTGITPASTTLAPGDTASFTADDYSVVFNDLLKGALVNEATATGAAARGGAVTSSPARASVPTSVSGTTSCERDVVRVGGEDRYQTAALLSERTFGAGAPVVYVASGQNFPDALGGGVAAGHRGAPLLLVTKTGVPKATAVELTRLAPGRIVVLGQTNAVSAKVTTALKGYTTGSVTRVGGTDRYATAALLATASYPNGARTAYLASGEVFPDALSGGPSAVLADAPMLLTNQGRLPAVTSAALKRLGVTKVVVLGGTDAVAGKVARAVDDLAGVSVKRIAGPDRYATSVAIAQYTFPELAAPPVCRTVYVATGEAFADALTGGPVASLVPGPVLLTPTAALAAATGTEVQRYTTDRAIVLGGTVAVSKHAAEQLTDRIGR